MTTSMNLRNARALIAAAESKAGEIGISVATTVVDVGGNLLTFARMDGTQLASTAISQGKAYTAVSWERPSGDLWEIAQPGAGGFGINTIDPRFVIAGGGLPLVANGILVGAVGVSGGTADEDTECAIVAVARFAEEINHYNEIAAAAAKEKEKETQHV